MAKKMSLPVAKAGGSATIKDDGIDLEQERKYRARHALEDIERAEGHKRDKDLMRDVKKEARDKVKTLKKIC